MGIRITRVAITVSHEGRPMMISTESAINIALRPRSVIANAYSTINIDLPTPSLPYTSRGMCSNIYPGGDNCC